jgi:YHS domain-containing protein
MALPLIRIVFPLLAATLAFGQTPSPVVPQKGDTLAKGRDTTVKASAKKVKEPKAATTKLKPQSTCPVLGSPIDKSLYVDYQGKRIYVCCAECIDKVKKSPAKYLEKIRKSGQSVEIIDSGKVNQASPAPDKAPEAKGSGMGSMKM